MALASTDEDADALASTPECMLAVFDPKGTLFFGVLFRWMCDEDVFSVASAPNGSADASVAVLAAVMAMGVAAVVEASVAVALRPVADSRLARR